ncbi:MAG: Outer membrane protein assembly factor BamB [Alphaproteobacteria bacterium MarineAlpha9_Bin4]|nr:hypothetical protein [Pelagibacterales bacterium]PPR26152.1 MAG: Outer membrane protein assembly factor BamB [Alphaproteobacteria bacterium MarineAlpha9_Bin4]
MKKIVNLVTFIILGIIVSSCGTGEFLGFEKRKVPLEGKRVSVLKDIGLSKKNNLSSSKIELGNSVVLENWRQSFNSPTHISFNYKSESKFNKFYRIVSGKGKNPDNKILSQPIISDNNIFFLDALSNVYAYDLENKKLKWKKSIVIKEDKGHDIGGGIAADTNFLFIGSPYGEVLCLELKTGAVIWKKNIQTPIRATPTLVENKLIILALDNRTLVFDKTDGNLIWEHQGIQNSTSIIGQPKVAVDGNLVLTPYSNGDIFALNLTNGTEIWKQSLVNIEQSETSNSFSDIDANPVVLKSLIIIASNSGRIFAFNKKNGNQVWVQYLNTTQTPVVNGNSLFVLHNNKEIVNLDLKNGKIRWIAEIEESLKDKNNYLWLSPVLVNSKLILVGGNKSLIILNPYDGTLENKYSLPSIPVTSPLIINKKVFIMFKNSSIYTIE